VKRQIITSCVVFGFQITTKIVKVQSRD